MPTPRPILSSTSSSPQPPLSWHIPAGCPANRNWASHYQHRGVLLPPVADSAPACGTASSCPRSSFRGDVSSPCHANLLHPPVCVGSLLELPPSFTRTRVHARARMPCRPRLFIARPRREPVSFWPAIFCFTLTSRACACVCVRVRACVRACVRAFSWVYLIYIHTPITGSLSISKFEVTRPSPRSPVELPLCGHEPAVCASAPCCVDCRGFPQSYIRPPSHRLPAKHASLGIIHPILHHLCSVYPGARIGGPADLSIVSPPCPYPTPAPTDSAHRSLKRCSSVLFFSPPRWA